MSVAVVMTGTALRNSAMPAARALAPPIWPDSSGMTKRPCSSMETMAGSFTLLRMKGAMVRMAIPVAPMKMMRRQVWNAMPHNSFRDGAMTFRPACGSA